MAKQSELEKLLAEKEKLDSQIETIRADARSGALAEVKEKIVAFGISAAELGFGSPRTSIREQALRKQRPPVAPKYRDPESGKTWSGRGKPPHWIAGKEREEFAIA